MAVIYFSYYIRYVYANRNSSAEILRSDNTLIMSPLNMGYNVANILFGMGIRIMVLPAELAFKSCVCVGVVAWYDCGFICRFLQS